MTIYYLFILFHIFIITNSSIVSMGGAIISTICSGGRVEEKGQVLEGHTSTTRADGNKVLLLEVLPVVSAGSSNRVVVQFRCNIR